MYTLNPIVHPVLDRIRPLGACYLKEERPTGQVYAFVDPSASPADIRSIRKRLFRTSGERKTA
jgi:hypothetical protein